MIQIELRSSLPIYEQIVSQVKALVLRGALTPGDAMPSIRKLAEQTRTNPNTVARAYQELERTGLIENRIGKGAFVSEQTARDDTARRRAGIRVQLRPPLMELMLLGLPDAEIQSEVQIALSELRGEV